MSEEIEQDLIDKENEMKLKEKEALEFYCFLKANGYILYEAVVGSQAHGTAIETSDIDKSFVYILPKDHIYGTKYREQLKVNKDYTGFEIRRFLELAHSNNPTILELFFGPEDCIETMHPSFKHAIDIRDRILTKRCKNSFNGYTRKQIDKAKGLDKLQNWEKERVTRKEPIDFCYVIDETGYGTKPLAKFLEETEREQKFCGLTKLPNARDNYALFYDRKAHECFSERVPEKDRNDFKAFYKEAGKSVGLGYKGVTKSGEGLSVSESNQLRLSSIPKGEKICASLIYNKDSYTSHCKDYAKYQKWLEERNMQRWVETSENGQMIDGKNMMHGVRLVQISREIAENGTVTIRRPNREELLSIRRGQVSLEDMLVWLENEMKELSVVYDNCNLPEEVDSELIHQTLVKIRTEFYDNK